MLTISVLGVFNADLKFTVQQFPKQGETIHAQGFAVQPGGKGFNQAVAARRAGAQVNMLTQLGDDEFARLAFDVMHKEGINANHISQNAQRPTGTALIMLESNSGQNQIVIAAGAASLLSTGQISQLSTVIASSDLFMTNFEVPVEIALEGLKIARKNGVPTLLDPAPAQPLTTEIYALVDYLTPNETEAETLTGIKVVDISSAERAGKWLCEQGVGTTLLTLGDQGVVLVTDERVIHTPVFPIDGVIDTTGAGDAFNGAFAANLNKHDLQSTLAYATAAAALSVTRNGAADAMATHNEITALLGK